MLPYIQGALGLGVRKNNHNAIPGAVRQHLDPQRAASTDSDNKRIDESYSTTGSLQTFSDALIVKRQNM